MSLLQGIRKLLSRMRHGRGFGIHSPFAYRFVTEVLRQEYGYYAYLRLRGDDDSRLVFRIVLALRPAKVAFVGCSSFRRAVDMAMPKAQITTPDKADMIIVDGSRHGDFDLSSYPHAHVIVKDYRRLPSWNDYCRSIPAGMTFANGGSMAVAVTLPHLPRQDFDVKF